MLIWLAARYLFFLIFVQLGFFRFFKKIKNNKKQQLNSCFRCNCMTPHRNTESTLDDNIILHTMNIILFPCAKNIFCFSYNSRTRLLENVLNNVLMIANNKEHNFLLLFKNNMRKCFIFSLLCSSIFFCRCSLFKKNMYVNICVENNEAKANNIG